MPNLLAVIHFQIPSQPGEPGVLSTGMSGAIDKLPAVLKKNLEEPGTAWRFACTTKFGPGPQHVMSHLAGFVNCKKCRATQAWKDAPDNGPVPKDPNAVPEDDVKEFLGEDANG